MARVILSETITIRGARRALTRRGSHFTLTRRHGNIYTYHKPSIVQPNTPAQLAARDLLRQANILAREDLLRPGRREYWTRQASEKGYKTPIGCARAHFFVLLKAEDATPHPAPSKTPAAKRVKYRRRPSNLPPSPVITITRHPAGLRLSSLPQNPSQKPPSTFINQYLSH